MKDTPQTPTDGEANTQTPATEVKAQAAPAAEATTPPTDKVEGAKAPEQAKKEAAPEKKLPGLSVEKPAEAETKTETRPGAPEKYEWKIEGEKPYVESITSKFEPVARKLGLSNDEAHGVYDTFAAVMRDNSKALFERWATELEQDKEIGGAKLEENLGLANTIVQQYGDDEFRGLLDKAGLRHNPAIVRMLVRMAKDVGGDRLPRVPDRSVGRAKAAGAWDYPTMNK